MITGPDFWFPRVRKASSADWVAGDLIPPSPVKLFLRRVSDEAGPTYLGIFGTLGW